MAEQDQKQSGTAEDEVQETAQSEAETAPVDDAAAEQASEGQDGKEAANDQQEPSLEGMVAQLQADVEAARDAALRSQADAHNVKRPAEQDEEKARKFSL